MEYKEYDWRNISIKSKDLTEDFIWEFKSNLDLGKVFQNNRDHLTKEFIKKIIDLIHSKKLSDKIFYDYSPLISITRSNISYPLLLGANLEVEELIQLIRRDDEGNIISAENRQSLESGSENFVIFYTLYTDYKLDMDTIIEYFDHFESMLSIYEFNGIKRRMKFKGYDLRKKENASLRLFLKLKGRL